MPARLAGTAPVAAVVAIVAASLGAVPDALAMAASLPAIVLAAPAASPPVKVIAGAAVMAAAPLVTTATFELEPVVSLLEVAALVAVLRAATEGASFPRPQRLRSPVGLAFASTPFLLLGAIPFARGATGPEERMAAIGASRGFSIAAPLSPTSPLVLLTTAAAGVDLGRYLLGAAPLALLFLGRECYREAGRAGATEALLAVAVAAPVFPLVAVGSQVVPWLSPVQLLVLAGVAVAMIRRRPVRTAVGEEWALFGTAGLVSAVALGYDATELLASSVLSVAGHAGVVALAGALAFALYQVGVHPVLGAPVIAASAARLGEGTVPVVLAIVVCGAVAGTVSRFSGQAQLSRIGRTAHPYWEEQGRFAVLSCLLAVGWGLVLTSIL